MFFNRIFNICMSLNNIETSVRRLITLIKSNFDMLEYLNNIEIHVYHSILNKTLQHRYIRTTLGGRTWVHDL